jgi:uncharacterized iron-regulated membrane protein
MKKIFGWIHLWLGLAAGLVILVVALSGSLLVFRTELEHLFQPSLFYVQPMQARHSVDEMAATVQARFPKYKLNYITVEPAANRTVLISMRKGKGKTADLMLAAVNPYTGEITKTVDEQNMFFEKVERLHRFLCLGDVGKVITGISCSIFVIMLITGMILWWPNKKNKKQRFKIKWDASFKRLNWDLHAVSGFYINIFVLIIALIGLVWSYKWVDNLFFYAFDGKPAPIKAPVPKAIPVKGVAYFDQMLTRTDSVLTFRGPVTIRFGEKDSLAIAVSKLNTEASVDRVIDILYFQAGTAKLVAQKPFAKETLGFRARRLLVPIHTGAIYGWPTKILALICALIAASLPVTGFLVWWGRKNMKTTKKASPVKKRVYQS